MDFIGREAKGVKVPGTWIPCTPAKPIPTRGHTIMGETHGGSRPNWLESMGIGLPADFVRLNPNAASLNSAPSVDQRVEFNNWESALSMRAPEPTVEEYSQRVNATNPMNLWNNVPFTDLLALANAASGVSAASASSKQREGNNATRSRHVFPFSLPENDHNQLQLNSNMFVEQNYSNRRNINNQAQQMPQGGFPVCYNSTYDLNLSPRTVYDLNSAPTAIGDAASNGSISFQSAPVTPNKVYTMQHSQSSEGVSNGNMSFQFAATTPDMASRMQRSIASENGPFQFAQLAPGNTSKMQHHQLLEALSRGNTLSQFAPLTPTKGGVMQNNQPLELVNDFQDETNKSQEDADPKRSKYLELHSSQESCLESVVNLSNAALKKPLQPASGSTTCVDISTPTKENHQLEKGEENGIDLNKTPQQKARRKKHRPKVIREGKPKKTPKSTVKQQTDGKETPKVNSDGKETPRVKRKYVRRNGVNTSTTPPTSTTPQTDVAGEIDAANKHAAAAVRSCKRSLNFDMEGQGHESNGKTPRRQEETLQSKLNNTSSSFAFNISESQVPELCTRNKDGSRTTVPQFPNGLEVMMQNSLADVAFDLNRHATKILGDYISLPESTPQPTRRELLRQNLKVLGRDGHDARTAEECPKSGRTSQQEIRQPGKITENVLRNQSGFQSESKSRNDLSCSQHPLLSERQENSSKRAHSQTIDEARLRAFNLIGPHIHEMLQGNDDLRNKLFPEIFKKRRTTSASKSHVATVGDDQKDATTHYSKDSSSKLSPSQWNSFQHCNASNKLSPSQGHASHHCNANSTESLRNVASARGQEYCSPSLPSGHIRCMQNIPGEPLSSTEEQRRITFDNLNSSELMLTIRQTEMKTGKRSKAHTRVRDFASLTSVTQCNNLQSPLPRNAPAPHDRSAIEAFQGTRYSKQSPSVDNQANMPISKYNIKGSHGNMVSFSSTNMRLQEQQAAIHGYRRYSAKSRGSMEVIQQFSSPIDDLVQKLECLSMSRESNAVSANVQNALVPFKGDDRIIPFKGDDRMVIFDLRKKRKPRPKVDLDAETDRVWKLLMGKEASEDTEGTSADKEKWWEEERRVFQGRADSFIARMHLIQGDRRFSKWTGSVLDSVIGVFLTQNVSDHLSSSAFMSLAARFPLEPMSDDKTCHLGPKMYVEEPEVPVLDFDNTKWHERMPHEPVRSQDSQGSVTLHIVDHIEDKEMGNISESFESNTGGGCSSDISDKEFGMCQEASKTEAGIQMTGIGCARFVEAEDGRLLEAESSGISPQNSVDSSLFQGTVGNMIASNGSATLLEADRRELEDGVSSKTTNNLFVHKKDDVVRSCSDSNSEEEDVTIRCKTNGLNSSTSFMELLRTTVFQDYYNPGIVSSSIDLNSEICYTQSEPRDCGKRSNLDTVNAESNSFSTLPSSSEFPRTAARSTSFSNCCLQASPNTEVLDVQCAEKIRRTVSMEQRMSLNDQAAAVGILSLNKQSVHPNISSEDVCLVKQQNSWGNILEINRMSQLEGKKQSTEPEILDPLAQSWSNGMQRSSSNAQILNPLAESNGTQQASSNSPNFSGETLDVVESTHLFEKKDTENADAESVVKEQVYSSNPSHEKPTKNLKPNGRPTKEKKKEADWDCLRREAYQKCGRRERNRDTMDSLDWEAVRCADVNEIAKAIKERGMNNMLAERIKDFLNRLVREHEHIDLEWLRDVPPDKAKEYLLSVRGLGLKSVECVRLLTLHHLAFPVDTNVGRIAVRLGWVPLQPLPESLQLHLLEMYPILESIQKYLWPRLCTLDQRTLYELHYQLITFGKVFCTKSKPNCNACPMRAECKHFASAFASARFALPGPEEKGIVSSTVPAKATQQPAVGMNPMSLPPPAQQPAVGMNPMSLPPPAQQPAVGMNPMSLPPPAVDMNPLSLPPPESNILSETRSRLNNSEPIIEQPASPEPECNETLESDIEDAFCEDPDDIPTIKLDIEDFALNLQNYMQQNNMELQDGDMSKALVALNPDAASIPTAKLKNVGRLRTEHQVYELPDAHPLLEGVEKRVPHEVCSYLLAIWTPGETAESIQPPEQCCSSQMTGNLCNETTCFSCNSTREATSQTVRGTLLIPCKTANRGSFPLNGTYFQVNEVFADHESSLQPIDVPRIWLWNLPRRTVYFGTSIPSIFKGQTTEQIQSCFWRGYVCVRGFDRKSRAPRPLMARLHFPASKLAATRTKQKETGNPQEKPVSASSLNNPGSKSAARTKQKETTSKPQEKHGSNLNQDLSEVRPQTKTPQS